ncbi:MAG: tetratricopeptide repeat protein, partial [Gammaproteobacteria bacterium]|nr:tetratricopeptide repeat protein [Gammaproteobacteria bacterium]
MAFMTEWFWFFLLLPAAALSGWVIGRRGGERHSDTQVSRLSTTYFRGLNYLLSEQPDKAIELFLHIAELDKDTFETQIALGHLFRRRGEVDRAIRLHQGLVQRNDLSDQQRVEALLALGEDYMKSGLLDRAETVFTELAQLDQRAPQALKHLIS